MINRLDSMPPLPLELGLESIVRLVMAVEAQRLEVAPVKPPLPTALGLDWIDVMHLNSNRPAFLALVPSFLHLCFRHPLPIRRGVELGVLRVSLLVVARVPQQALLLECLSPLFFRNRFAGGAIDAWIRNERTASSAWL